MSKERTFIVIANYLTFGASTIQEDLPRLMGVYRCEDSDSAFRMFLEQHAPTVAEAQKFYDSVIVIDIKAVGHEFLMSDYFGKLAKFPNPDIFPYHKYYI